MDTQTTTQTQLHHRSVSVLRPALAGALALAALVPAAPVAAAAPIAAAAPVAAVDEGMWLFNKPPAKLLKERYGFDATPAWLEHVMKSCVRFPGGSGSIVSADGLVMTNHHVGRDWLEKLSSAEHNIMEEGFYAPTREQELACPDLELRVLWTIEDRTAAVLGSAAGLAAAEAETARKKKISELESAAEDASGLDCQMVTLYGGGQYHLYSYQRYTDVRLVFAPEEAIAFFGGDTDNFEFPRYDLDCTFFRIYENGAPLEAEHFLAWSQGGAADGELVFVAGHPGSTNRLDTVADIEYQRDVSQPLGLAGLWRREVQLATFMGRGDENHRIALNDYFSVQNSRKARTGILEGLLDPAFMAEKRRAEADFRAKVAANPEWQRAWGDAWDTVAAAKQTQRAMVEELSASSVLGWSQLFGTARHLVRLGDELPKPSADRLREYRDTALDSLKLSLFSPAPIYPALETEALASALQRMAELLGADDPFVQTALGGQGPRARAESLVAGTKLLEVAERQRLFDGGKQATSASDDPLIRLALALDPKARELRKRFEDEVDALEKQAYEKISAARFAVYGDSVYPDATFTLRLAFGPAKGYEQDGQTIEPFTVIEGLYERSAARGNVHPFELPASWEAAKGGLELGTPFNFVHTSDIIGGNSGSPTINAKGEVVGLIFDGNIQSLSADIGYSDVQGRALSVDSRGMLEAFRNVYRADALVKELTARARP